MNTAYIFFGVAAIVGIVYLLLRYLDKCPHNWELIEKGTLSRSDNDDEVGGYSAYQCSHCKKYKTETWRIDKG